MRSTVANVCAELEALPPAAVDTYAAMGFDRLAQLLGCREGILVFGARICPPEGDPLAGFRVLRVWHIGARNVIRTGVTDAVQQDDRLLLEDVVSQRMAREAGRHRTYHEPDPRTVPGLERSIDAGVWTNLCLHDHLKGVHTLDADRELYFGFHRLADDEPFTSDDVRMLEELLPAIHGWARRLVLLCGGRSIPEPLTRREGEMLVLLLGGAPQKTHAGVLGVSAPRARELVRAVHAKLGTASRAELQRLWMTARHEIASVPPVIGRLMLANQRKRARAVLPTGCKTRIGASATPPPDDP